MRVVSKEPEAHLVELLQLVESASQGWQVVLFDFSKLLEHYRSEYQLKIATNLMNDLLGDRDGAIYLAEDSTVYVMVRNFPRQLMEKMIFQLRYLFMDDPLAYSSDGEENPAFSTLYDLEGQWQDVMNLIKRRLIVRVRQAQNVERAVAEEFAAGGADALRAFTANNLAAIERDMQGVDLTPTIRRQPICAALPGADVRTAFDEIYININHLRQSLNIKVDLLSNRWLFKYLTQILDERMLDMIQRNPARYLGAAISMNVNIQTLLSSRFAEFHSAVRSSAKVTMVFELQVADVFTDMAGFLLAKETVQKLGYRVCLDGVSELSLPHIDRQRLGFDFVKLIWNSDHEHDVNSPKNAALADAIRKCGTNRVILTRCDTKQAVEYGQAMGITLFQGRYLDSVVNPKAAIKN